MVNIELLTLQYSFPQNYDADFMAVKRTPVEGLSCCCYAKHQHRSASTAKLWRVS